MNYGGMEESLLFLSLGCVGRGLGGSDLGFRGGKYSVDAD